MRKIESSIYFVKKGDTLESISKKFNINPTTLLIKNNITPKMISAGMVLKIK